MKKLDIVIPHEYFVDVNKILHKHKVGGMSFSDIKGRGRSRNQPMSFGRRAATYIPEFTYRIKIEVVVSDSLAKVITSDLLKLLRKSSGAFGKIFVSDVLEAYDIGTKEKETAAI